MQCGFCRRAFDTSVLQAEPPVLEDRFFDLDDEVHDWHFAELTGAAASTLLTWEGDDAE